MDSDAGLGLTATTDKPAPKPEPAAGGRGARTGRRNPFSRTALLYREVVAELRKVIWPTRHELISYTIVVLVFVTIMVSIVSLFDYGFTQAVSAVFG